VSGIAGRLAAVRDAIARAAARAGRAAEEVRILAVTKNVELPEIREAVAAGISLLGENRVQEAERKIREASDLAVSWHMIGHLQRNKARRAVELFDEVESVDSVALAERLSGLALEKGRRLRVLVEVLTSPEGTKRGFDVEAVEEAVGAIQELRGLELRGLMTMAPFTGDERLVRASFRALRELRERLGGAEPLPELSMGMSGDYEIAVEEGATLVRIGTRIFR
jgi:pyridoxal phosphate enzyme (YggS family)